MTINQAIEFMLKNEKDEKKIKCIENLDILIMEAKNNEKIDGRKLFELVEKLVREWPELVTMLLSLTYVASVGFSDADIDPKDISNMDLSEFMTEE